MERSMDQEASKAGEAPNPAVAERLRIEAEFQNKRVDAEPRDKFYFLAEKALARYKERLCDVEGKRVLVVGCDVGGVTPMARRGANVTGIDISDASINRLRKMIEKDGLSDRARAYLMDAEDPDLPPASFDIICCTGVLHHLDIERASSAWSRLLAPGGEVVMIEPLAWNPAAAAYRLVTPKSRSPLEHPLKPKDFRTLRRFFRRVEFEAFAFATSMAAPMALFPSLEPVQRRVVKALDLLDRGLFKILPPLKYAAWIAVILCREPRESS